MKTPLKLTDVDTAFGGRAMEILPPMADIPFEFESVTNKWHALAQKWFYNGLKVMPPVKAGLDRDDVQKNLAAALRSFEPKHEHKMAGVAYLMSLWLEDKEESTLMSYADVKT